MSPEVIASAMLGVAVVFTGAAYLYNRVQRSKAERLRNLAAIEMYLQRCWRIMENLPLAYMPASLRATMCKLIRHRLESAMRLDPRSEAMLAHLGRLESFEAGQERSALMETPKPNLRPAERKQISQLLREVKLILRNGLTARIINKDEYIEGRMVVDALLLRILVDHLKANAVNSEKLGHMAEATSYLQRARNELANADRALYAEEIADMDRELARLHHLGEAGSDKRPSEKERNTLLEAWEAEARADDVEPGWRRAATA